MIRLLITGGRNFDDQELLDRALEHVHNKFGIAVLIHGDASGADKMAGAWASARGIEVLACPADWKKFGRAAGPIRNKSMLNEKPDMLLAFPGGTGTRHMVSVATKAELPIIHALEITNGPDTKSA